LEFFIDIKSFRSHYGPGVDSASNRNEYREYFLGVKSGRYVRLTTLPPSCAVVMKSGNLNFLEPSGPLRASNGTALPLPLLDYGVMPCPVFVSHRNRGPSKKSGKGSEPPFTGYFEGRKCISHRISDKLNCRNECYYIEQDASNLHQFGGQLRYKMCRTFNLTTKLRGCAG